jgi:cytochrome P450
MAAIGSITTHLWARGLPLVGHAPWFHADTTGFLLDLSRTQGDIARFRLGGSDAFLLSHPDQVKRVLVDDAELFGKGRLMQRARRLLGNGLLTSERELHRTQRRCIQPAFSRAQVAAQAAEVPRLAARLADRWVSGSPVNVSAAMDELSLAIVVQALLGADIEDDAAALAAELRLLARWFPLLLLPGAGRLERAGLPPFFRAGRAVDRIDTSVRGLIAAAAGSNAGGLLPLLLDPASDDGMAPELVRDEVMTLFLAGHDTTAAALTWAWHLIAAHPDVGKRLRAELTGVLGDRDPTPDDYADLAYTGMVFDEVLRLYPPIGRIGRRPLADYAIDGVLIPRDSAVFVSPFVTQRDPRWWAAPERFDPDRWTAESRASRPRFAAFPFGAGPRSCVGGQMARMMGVLVIATIARRWRMSPPTGRAPRVRSLLTLKPRRALVMRVERAFTPSDRARGNRQPAQQRQQERQGRIESEHGIVALVRGLRDRIRDGSQSQEKKERLGGEEPDPAKRGHAKPPLMA